MSWMSGISGLGSAGGVGAGGYSASSSAESEASGGNVGPNLAAGNRGFLNNVAFPGATVNADPGINAPLAGRRMNATTVLFSIGALIVALAVVKKFLK